MIGVAGLRKAYGALVAVDGVSFEIATGETFGLLGPNGAGKTTTIHMLVGALRPDGGTIHIDGAEDPTRAEVRRRIGLAPQASALYDDLTGEENLAFFARLYGYRGAALRGRVDWALGFAGLSDRRRHRVTTYSGGMQRRLNLACALVHDPKVLFLDEPTVGVDPQSRNHVFASIEALRRQGRTILYTTHYMEEAQRLCDRVAILDRGRVLALDTVDALIARHGGKSVVEATFRTPPPDAASLGGSFDGERLRVETDQPLEAVARLAEGGLKLQTLRVDRPDLETVFLSLTGRRLRDA
jgi:ABC-2 type transport system ATP-binding protein